MYTAHRTPHALATLFLAALAGTAHGQMYHPIAIPPLPGTDLSAALGVNDDGDVVGWCRIPPGSNFHGFLYDRSTNTTIDLGNLGGGVAEFDTGAHSITNAGRVVGVYRPVGTGIGHSFTWTAATGFADISFAPAQGYASYALSIGEGGQIGGANSFACPPNPNLINIAAAGWTSHVAQAMPVISTSFACVYVGRIYGVNASGQMAGETIIAVPGGTKVRAFVVGGAGELPTYSGTSEVARAFDVSDDGWACGEAQNRSPGVSTDTACVWSPGGAITNLNATQFSRALGINTSHDVVGWDTQGPKRGAIWFGAVPVPVNLNTRLTTPLAAGQSITDAEDISNSGFIACRTNHLAANSRAVLLEPCTPGIVSAPLPQTPNIGGTATYTVSAMGAGTLTHQWRRNTIPLTDGPTGNGSTITGALTDSLTITTVAAADQGTFDVVLTSACGSATSTGAALTVPPCTADFNGDHAVNTLDLIELLSHFGQSVAPGSTGDINSDGTVNTLDLLALLAEFGRVCP